MLRRMSDAPQTDPAFLTTKEVAALLRVRERKVYEMASAGEIPCRKVTGKLLFPRTEIEAWLSGDAAAAQGPASPPGAAPSSAPSVIVGSHDPLLEWALRAAGCEAPTLFGGSLDGLARLARGEAIAAAIHIFDPETEAWNTPALAQAGLEDRFALIGFATRRQGLVFAPQIGRRGEAPRKLRDLKGRRVALRQPAAGGRVLFEALLAAEGLALSDFELAGEEARSEAEIAEAVAAGQAEAALGLEAMARRLGLGFTPLIEERFDLLVERRAFFDPPLQKLFAFARGAAFRERAAGLAGYDVSECGLARWNGG